MQTDNEWTKQYYNEEAQKILAERGKLWSPEQQVKVSKDWLTLIADIKAASAKGVKPESTEGQVLVDRWDKLVEGFTGGHTGVQDGARKVWANAEQLPAEVQRSMQLFKDAMSSEVTAFMAKAKAARTKG